MDSAIFGWGSLPIENMPVSDHLTFGIATNPTSDAHSFHPQGPSAVDDSWADRRPESLDIIPARTHNRLVDADTETHPSSLSLFIPATYTRDVDEGARTLLENDIADIRGESSSVAHSPDKMFRTEVSLFIQTLMNSNEVLGFPLIISNDHLAHIDHGSVLTTFKHRQGGESMNVSSLQSHQYTQSSNSEPSIPSGISCAPAIVQYQGQRASRGPPQQIQKQGTGQGPTTSSSRSSRRPVGVRGAHNGPYLCNVCGKRYAQSQGVWRHYWETHDARLCSYCGIFKWGRPYLYKKHLQKKHADVDFHAALDEAMGAGRV